MFSEKRPTARDLAGSAVDLNGYATFFTHVCRLADKNGDVKIKATRLLHIAEFMEKVVDELLELIPPDPVDDAKNPPA